MTRFPPSEPALSAAARVIEAHAVHPDRNLVEVELSAWLLGSVEAKLPTLLDPVERAHAELAAAAGRQDGDAVIEVLDQHVVDGDTQLLTSACELAGLFCPDQLIEFAHRHRASRFVGRMLATTTRPERLLDLVPISLPLGTNVVDTHAELIIHHRNNGQPNAAVEQRWAQIVAHGPVHLAGFRDSL